MIKIIVVGKMKKDYLSEGVAYYLKQIPLKTEIIEIKDEPLEQGIFIEGRKILEKINKEEYVIGLVIEGTQYDSISLSQELERTLSIVSKDIVFVIGGSYGLSNDVLERLNKKFSLSKLTFPHQIVRLLLVEQLYRSFMIMKNHP